MAFPPLTLPVNALTLTMNSTGTRMQSPYSYAQATYDFMGGAWSARLDMATMTQRDRATFMRFIASLDGPFGTFQLLANDYGGPYGTVTVNPVIAAVAAARARTITVTLTPGDVMVADDRITIDGHLHIVTAAAAKVGDDQVLTIWPRLRADIAVSDPVEALAPFGSWALAQQSNSVSLTVDGSSSATLELIEAI